MADKAHAVLSPSGSHRWMHCAGSIEAERGLPDTSGAAAAEGTRAHSLAEYCLSWKIDPTNAMFAPKSDEFVFTPVNNEMAEAVQLYYDTVMDRASVPGAVLTVEEYVNLSKLKGAPPELEGGTTDAKIVNTSIGWLDIIDLKYGRGVVVEVIDNSQLRMYALGAYLSLTPAEKKLITNVRMTIVQPRAEHEDGPVRSDTITVKALKAWAKILVQRAQEAMTPGAPRVAGEWCGWCKAKSTCRVYDQRALAIAQTEFSIVSSTELVPPDPAELSPEQERYIITNAPILREWLKMVEARGLDRAMAGSPPLWMAVRAKRGTRKWTDAAEVDGWAATEGVEHAALYDAPKLKSPAQLEKVLKPLKLKLPSDLTVMVSSGYALCEADDPRALPTGTTEFEILPNPEAEENE